MRVKGRVSTLLRATWLIACCATASGVRAQAVVDETAIPNAVDGEYQNLVQQALHEYELGNFSEARSFFARAHALSPNSRTLRGLGMSAYELRNYVDAIDLFEQALASQQRPLTQQMRREITELLAHARSFVTHLELRVEPKQAELRVDTRTVRREPDGSLLLDPGTHELEVDAPEYDSTTRTIRTNGGETLTLSVALKKSAGSEIATTAEAPAAESLPSAAPETTARDSGGNEWAPWVVIGASGAVAVAGGIMLGIALSNKNAVEHPEGSGDNKPVWSDYESRDKLVFPLSVAGITALSLGVLGAATGLVWKVSTSGHDSREHAAFSVGPGQVHFRVSF
jgi:hypothetical protein